MGAGADLIIRIATKGSELAQAQLNGLGKSSQLLGGTVAKLAKVGIAALGIAMVGLAKGIASSIKSFAEFDEQLTQSLAIMQTDIEQKQRMIEMARQVATETQITSTQSAQAYFYLASAGLSAEQSIAALPQVAKFAQAGMFDMATATDLATDAQSALGLTVKDAQQNLQNLTRVTDVLVKANTLANATVQQFSEALTTKAGAALKVVNKDIEEGVAVLAAFADRGVKGAEAGDKLNQILRDIPRATAKNKDEFEKLGLEIFDTEGNMRNVADVIEELDRVLGPMSDEMKAATLDQLGLNRGVADGIKILSGSTDQIREYEKQLRDAGGTTEQVANKQLETLNAQIDILRNQINNLKQDIGEDLAPSMMNIVKETQTVVERFAKWREENHKLSEGIKILGISIATGLLLATGPIGFAIAGITAGIAGIYKWVKKGNEAYREEEEVNQRRLKGYQERIDEEQNLVEQQKTLQEATYTLNDVYDGQSLTVAELTALIKEYNIALDENTDEAYENAKAYEESLLGGLQDVINAYDQLQAIQDRIDRAEGKRNQALKARIEATNGIAKAQENLNNIQNQEKAFVARRDYALAQFNKEKEKSKKVTNEEQLAIERQRLAVAELENEQDGSLIKNLELQVANKRLAELISESTSATSEETRAQAEYQRTLDELEKHYEDVEKAQEAITKAKDAETEAIERLQEAQNELNKLTEKSARNLLEQALAQEALNKAFEDFGIGTKGYKDALDKIVAITGESLGEVDRLFDQTFSRAKSLAVKGIDFTTDTSSISSTGKIIGGDKETGSQKFPTTPSISAERRSEILGRIGETNINIYNNAGTIIGSDDQFVESVATAYEKAVKRGVSFT